MSDGTQRSYLQFRVDSLGLIGVPPTKQPLSLWCQKFNLYKVNFATFDLHGFNILLKDITYTRRVNPYLNLPLRTGTSWHLFKNLGFYLLDLSKGEGSLRLPFDVKSISCLSYDLKWLNSKKTRTKDTP